MSGMVCIYVIGRPEGPVKVGVASYPRGRASTLQIGCPFKIQVLHQRRMRDRSHALWHEKNFHEVWRGKHLRGEWFDLDAELAAEGVDTALEIEDHFEDERRRGLR